jgi:hypothetical protein
MSHQAKNEMKAQELRQSLLADVKATTPQTLAEVSEEQLQQITGGCIYCSINRVVIHNSNRLADYYSWHAEGDAARGNRKQAQANALVAAEHKNRANVNQLALTLRQDQHSLEEERASSSKG